MLHQNYSQQLARRKAVILLVVISLLTLFAIVGISFVLYANAAADSSKLFRDAAAQSQPDMDPELLLNYFLGQLIFDVNDDATGVYSSMRGQSLSRNMFGQPFVTATAISITPVPGTQQSMVTLGGPAPANLFPGMKVFGPGLPSGSAIVSIVSPLQFIINQPAQVMGPVNLGFYVPSTQAYNGTGRLHTSGTNVMNPFGVDDWYLVNYTYNSADQFIRDQEVFSPYIPGSPVGPAPHGTYTGGANVPYTYPDLNNMFLAAVMADGTVLMPSFNRQWLFNLDMTKSPPQPMTNPSTGAPYTLGDQNNPNWTNAWGKYMLLRPRPQDMGSGFPYPEDGGGDVKNLPGPGTLVPGTGLTTGVPPSYYNNDSFWMDLGAPVMTAPDGTKFKALFAPLIIDLDNRVNLNVAGNIRGLQSMTPPIAPNSIPPGPNVAHRSNQGWGPWEMNLEYIFKPNPTTGIYEWPNLFLGNGTIPGRYGANQVPGYPGSQAPGDGTTPHIYSQADFDGANEQANYGFTGRVGLPQAGAQFTSFPAFPQGFALQYGMGGYGNGAAGGPEKAQHPLVFNYFQPRDPSNPASDDLTFPVSNMEALLRYGDTNSPALTSDLFRLCPTNFQNNNNPRARNLLTTLSFDLDQPGLSPWVWDPGTSPGGASTVYQFTGGPPYPPPTPYPQGNPITYPQLGSGSPPSGSEFQADWRAIDAALGKVNLNRYLTPFPPIAANQQMNPNDPTVQQALTDRQQLATDIFIRLVKATGALDIRDPNQVQALVGSPSQQALYNGLRWLAQLAVNIVDYIDQDDIMTPFPWVALDQSGALNGILPVVDKRGNGWVFGTELPRVVINEAYAEFNFAQQPPPTPFTNQTTLYYNVNVWVELHNTIGVPPAPNNQDPADPNGGTAILQMQANAFGAAYPVYIFEITKPNVPSLPGIDIRSPDNVLGEPDGPQMTNLATTPTRVQPVADFTGNPPNPTCQSISPSNGNYSGPNGGNQGFYMLGPLAGTPPAATLPQGASAPPWPTASLSAAQGMSYQISNTLPAKTNAPIPAPTVQPPTLVLRRLACPYLQPTNPPTTVPQANPPPPQFGAFYNPYITVDYVEKLPVYDATGPTSSNKFPQDSGSVPVQNRYSVGRDQPFAATYSVNPTNSHQIKQAPNPQNQNQPQHTFFRHNGQSANPPLPATNNLSNSPPLPPTSQQLPMPPPAPATLTVPFNWPAHLDRKLISPMELLNVSAFKPHEFTQQFMYTGAGGQPQAYGQRAPWTDPLARIYRAFEFFETGNLAMGNVPGGRVPGRININTVYDPEPIHGICDANNSNYYSTSDVANMFNQMIGSRTPGLLSGTGFGASDRPYLGMAAGYDTGDPQYQNGLSIENTLLRSVAFSTAPIGTGMQTVTPTPAINGLQPGSVLTVDTGVNEEIVVVMNVQNQSFTANFQKNHNNAPVSLGRLFQPTGSSQPAHPYIQDQLLTKLFNNVTTRSNVFAVFVTVGFFQVTDDTVRPVKLGAEIGRSENRHIRHRMFAIVDRTNLTVEESNPNMIGPPPVYLPATQVPSNYINPAAYTYVVPGWAGTYEGIPWGITQGTNVVVDTGPNQELLMVSGTPTLTGAGPNLPGITLTGPTVAIMGVPQPTPPSKPHSTPFAITPVSTMTVVVPPPSPNPIGPGPVTLTLNALNGIQQNTNVLVDIGGNAETVAVQNVTQAPGQPPTITVTLSKSHYNMAFPAGAPLTLSYPVPVGGNPGPQANFDMRQVPWVVRYVSIIN